VELQELLLFQVVAARWEESNEGNSEVDGGTLYPLVLVLFVEETNDESKSSCNKQNSKSYILKLFEKDSEEGLDTR
jgi:hypothetical protein